MGEHIFKRKLYQWILEWKQENQGHTALLIEGAHFAVCINAKECVSLQP